jgi:CotS family spore coat protein
MYLEHVDHWICEGEKAVQILKNSNYKKITELQKEQHHGFCHHDFAYHNVLILNDNKIGLIDFDHAISDIRTHDLSSLILRNMKETKWDVNIAIFIMNEYFMEATPYSGEKELIYGMLQFPQDFYEIARYYYVEKRHKPKKLIKRLRKWNKQINYRNEFFSQFVKEIRKDTKNADLQLGE